MPAKRPRSSGREATVVIQKLQNIGHARPSEISSSDDDDDDVPLVKRRTISQKRTMRNADLGVNDYAYLNAYNEPSMNGLDAQMVEGQVESLKIDDANNIKSEQQYKPENNDMEEEETLDQHGDGKLAQITRHLDNFLDISFQEKELPTKLALSSIPLLRKFALYTLKSSQYKAIDRIDFDSFTRVIRFMEQMIIKAAEFDVIANHTRKRQPSSTTEDDKYSVEILEFVYCGLEASVIVFDLFTSCKFEQQLLSEALVMACLQFVKNLLDNIIYPIVDLGHTDGDITCLNEDVRSFVAYVESTPRARLVLSRILPLSTRFLRHLSSMLNQDDLEDDMIVTLVYISTGPIFHDGSSSLLALTAEGDTSNAYDQMKFSALDILRVLFGCYPQHRRWVLEEILSSINGLTTMDRDVKTYRLRNNESIHILSALFMQLVQCCCIANDRVANRNWLSKWQIKYQKAQKEEDKKQLIGLDDKLVKYAANVWKHGTEAAIQSATYFLEFLMSKCKSRKKDSYSLEEYRSILQHTMEDILLVLDDPEWPGSELILRVFTKILVAVLESQKTDVYLKSFAIEWLGIIIAKVKHSLNGLAGQGDSYVPERVYDLHKSLPNKITRSTPTASIRRLEHCRGELLSYLRKVPSNTIALQFYASTWGYQTSLQCSVAQNDLEEDPQDNENLDVIKSICKQLWLQFLDSNLDQSEMQSQRDLTEFNRTDIRNLYELILSRQSLYMSTEYLLLQIMNYLDQSSAPYRSKAIKAIGRIARDVPEILDDLNIRNAIVQKIHDNSPSVRDSAVEVMSRYLSCQEDIPVELYKIVSSRIMDTAVNVRKRLVNLLREMYFKCTDHETKVDIASKLMGRMGDADVSINLLSQKAMQEVFFQPFRDIQLEGEDHFGHNYAHAPKDRKRRIDRLVTIIIDTLAKQYASLSLQRELLSTMIQKIMDTDDDKKRSSYEAIFQWIVDAIFEKLLELDEVGDSIAFTICLATIHSFSRICPQLLRETHISMLQPYLSMNDTDTWKTVHYVLTIYRDVLPRQKHQDPSFIEMVERSLVRLLTYCPVQEIEPAVSCLCAIVSQISFHYHLPCKMLISCIAKLKQDLNSVSQAGTLSNTVIKLVKMLILCGSLCRHFDFGAVPKGKVPEYDAANFDKESVTTLIHKLLQSFMKCDSRIQEGANIRMAALQGLGFIYMAHPTYIISTENTLLFDDIFNSSSIQMKVQLMNVFHDFLVDEEKRLEKREAFAGKSLYKKVIDVDTLLGNTDEFAELGVNGSLMQRYLRRILCCALDNTPELRYSAFQVVAAIVNDGLAHPVLCMPVVIAAETSPDIGIRNKAYHLHRSAHDKYGAMLYAQIPEYLFATYEYQASLFGHEVRGYGPGNGDTKVMSHFELAYGLLKQKKKLKYDFLSALVRPFEIDTKMKEDDRLDLHYICFLADAVLTLEYTQSDELLFILHSMNRIILSVGADTLAIIQEWKNAQKWPENSCHDTMDTKLASLTKMAMAMYVLLRTQKVLQEAYDISESEMREYNVNDRNRTRALAKDAQVETTITWADTLSYLGTRQLDTASCIESCDMFESIIMESSAIDIPSDERS